jgi:hypothetical protein
VSHVELGRRDVVGFRLREKARKALLKDQPYLKDLWKLLIGAADGEVVAHEETVEEVARFFARGFFLDGRNARMRRMRAISCHENAARLWESDPGRYRIMTGYAFTEDDHLWRQHSWSLDQDGTVIETTFPREIYFGYILNSEESERFALANIYHRGN